jgi:hypothetical protein
MDVSFSVNPRYARGCHMRRLPISNRELERTIHKAWLELQQARADDHLIRTVWHERQMNEALDELGARIGWSTPQAAAA